MNASFSALEKYIAGMFRLPAFLFLLLSTFASLAQQTIQGTVIDVSNGQPLAGASVFISNTSKGTVTDKAGLFILSDVPAGQQDLIVSSIGFETNAFSFNSGQLPLKVKVEMQVKVRELQNVTVEPSVMEGWDKWGRVFTENFLGMTPNAARCSIKNYKSIRFRYYKKSNRLVAWSDEPLVIENKALGYTLRYQLEDFEVEFKNNTTAFAGYPFFEDYQKEGRKLKHRWEQSRDKAYYGSMMQFMRSVFQDSLAQNGFEVRRMVRTPNFEKQRVRAIASRSLLNVNGGKTKIQINSGGVGTPSDTQAGDSSAYYQRILRQEDHIDTYGSVLLTADSLVVKSEGDYKVVWFDDYLYVTYKKELEDQEYLDRWGEKRKRQYQGSHVWLVNKNALVIDANGSYSPPQELFSMSYWGWSEKIADLLPLDYRPGQ